MSTHARLDPSEWISQAEAARLRSVSRQAIAKLIRRGRVRKLVVAGRTLVHRDDILLFAAKPGGRPARQRKSSGDR